MSIEIVPWLLALDSGAKVALSGESPVPRDVLSDWARPGEGLRPIDHIPTSWVLRVMRKELRGEKWTLIGFYDSGKEFSNRRPHGFLGAGILARGGLVEGSVLQLLRNMIAIWKAAIDRGGKDIDKTAEKVWSNREICRGIATVHECSVSDPLDGGIQPGRGNHFFFVSQDDVAKLEEFLYDLQTGVALPCETVVFSSSEDLEDQAAERGYRVRLAAEFAAWRLGESGDERHSEDLAAAKGQVPSGLQLELQAGLAFVSDRGGDIGLADASNSGNQDSISESAAPDLHLREAVAHMIERVTRITDEAGALTSILHRLERELRALESKGGKPASRLGHSSFWRRSGWLSLTILLIGAALAIAAIFYLSRDDGWIKQPEPPLQEPRQGPLSSSPEDQVEGPDGPARFVLQYYDLLAGPNPEQALALRGISPDSPAGLRIVARRAAFQTYIVEQQVRRGSGPWLVTARIIASEAGRQVTGTVELVVERRPTVGPTEWYIRSVREDPAIALQ